MSTQLPLIERESPPFVRNSQTSAEAAQQITESAASLRAKLHRWLLAQPDGATDERMQDEVPMAQNTQRPRRVELVERGMVRDSGRRRKTRSGRDAVVWIAEVVR